MEHDKIHECLHSVETRIQLNELKKDHHEFAKRVFEKLEELDKALLSRLPLWATMGFAILTMILGALITRVLR